jgi:carbamoyltransferase
LIILGLNAHHADASACLLIDCKLVAAVEEERFTRIKHYSGFPINAVEFCLKEAGITLNDINHLAIGRDPSAKIFNKIAFALQSPFDVLKKYFGTRVANTQQINNIDQYLLNHFYNDASIKANFKVHHIEHHRTHLASAFYPSPFKEAAVLSLDGSGDFTTAMRAVGNNNDLSVIDSVDFPNSIGIFYSALTQFLGFMHYGDEYKVMGLAPYGKPIYKEALSKVLTATNDGWFKLNNHYLRSPHEGYVYYSETNQPIIPLLYNQNLVALLGKERKPDEPVEQFHKDMAASIQSVTEQIIFHIITQLHHKTKLNNLCLAGGVAQNSVANGKIIKNTPFKKVYIPSAGHDAGISMGAAFYVNHKLLKGERQPAITSAYTGPSFTNDQIEKVLQENNVSYQLLTDDEIFNLVSDKLIDGAVVGWFTGKAEFGPRALGGRSILMDPRRTDAKEILNQKIKRRESFRPFAPSILKEYVVDFFELVDDVPFMEKVFPIKEEKRTLIPAVTHTDGSGRLQTVDATVSPRYYGLIEAFRIKTGIPILLNTSFNENEPIVNTPQEALNCFLRTSMDMLVLENCVIQRS